MIKKTFIPLAWINLILTLSPIYTILGILVTIIYYFKSILNLIKKFFVLIIACVFLILVFLSSIDFSDTYISRIINVLQNVHSFEDFIYIEPSLATRIVCFINIFCIFLKHPILGIGIGNLPEELSKMFMNSPVVLTPENIGKFQLSVTSGLPLLYNNSIIYETLANYGIFIASIFFYFYYLLLKKINLLFKFAEKNSSNYFVVQALKTSLIAQLIIMFYSSYLLTFEINIIAFISVAIIYKYVSKTLDIRSNTSEN